MLPAFLSRESANITGAALVIGIAAFASRLLGVFRERLLVGRFGVGADLDAYYAAFQVPNIVYNFLILGVLSAAFIPVFVDLWQNHRDDAWRFANTVLHVTAGVMGVLSVIVFITAPVLVRAVAPGFSDSVSAEVAALTRILVISIFLFSLSNVFGSVLNAQKRFVAVSVAPLLYNISIIVGVLIAHDVRTVAWAVVVGAAAHLVLQILVAVSVGWRWAPVLKLRSPGVGTFFRLFVPRMWGVDISQVSVFLGTMIGSGLAVGSVALFNLATNIAIVPVAIFGYAYAIAAFPPLTESLARRDREEFIRVFAGTARQILFFLMPIGLWTIVLRAHIVRLIIGTRQLSWDDTRLAAAAVALFAITLCMQGMAPLLTRAFYAMKNTWIPVLVSAGAMVVFVLTAIGTLYLFGHDPEWTRSFAGLLRLSDVPDVRMLALPLAYSVAASFQVVVLGVLLRRRFGSFGGRHVARAAGTMLAATLLGALAAYGGLQASAGLADARTYMGVLIQFVFSALLGAAVYLMAAVSLKVPEAEVVLQAVKRRMIRITKPLGVGEGERL